MRTTVEVHLTADPAIERQIEGIIQALATRLQRAGAITGTWEGWSAYDLATALKSSDATKRKPYMGPVEAATIVLDGLLSPRDAEDVDLWGSPLGRALAYWGTGTPGAVSRSCAAAALNCGRANVALMLRDGKLSEAEGTCYPTMVTTASLAHAMRVKYPLEEI